MGVICGVIHYKPAPGVTVLFEGPHVYMGGHNFAGWRAFALPLSTDIL